MITTGDSSPDAAIIKTGPTRSQSNDYQDSTLAKQRDESSLCLLLHNLKPRLLTAPIQAVG
ncbi:hypothetical protein GCM10011502_10310 [Oceanisphaera marina]|uniref:Uncharacterized protein n=1 Tax=Oceanisphaera marina TaxID=2017550 RepID=A0ABQ1IH30_9GAMM|nr:hypothetical protein GCM10011502_10310 [Oceanisphaera marina]